MSKGQIKIIATMLIITLLVIVIANKNTCENLVCAEETNQYKLSGMAHIQTYGDSNGSIVEEDGISTLVLGSRGKSKRLEAVKIDFENNSGYDGNMQYRVHRQTYGWTEWLDAGQFAGTVGESKRLEAIEIRLTGELAKHYCVRYRAHTQTYGDNQGWVSDGSMAGTAGESKRLEEIKVQVIPRDSYGIPTLAYRVHRQTYGWESTWAQAGQVSGTTGEGKRLEGITISVDNLPYEGGVTYQTHVQSYGWMPEVESGEMSGTQGQAKRLEAIKINLTGDLAEHYDIYYRVHAQTYGWLDWVKNGECAGTAGLSKRLEAIQIVIRGKNEAKPESTYGGITNNVEVGYVDNTNKDLISDKDERWTITQYGNDKGGQKMFYTITNRRGDLVIVDGGYDSDATEVKKVIQSHGNHVSAWIITHPHPDHVGAFNKVMMDDASKTITIDHIYTINVNKQRYIETAKYYDGIESYYTFEKVISNMSNVTYLKEGDELGILGLKMTVISAWDSYVDTLSSNLCNNGSLMFRLDGREERMLFCGDIDNAKMEAYIMTRHKDDINADYIQLAHHGNWGLSTDFYDNCTQVKGVFFDGPSSIIDVETGSYDGYKLKHYFEGRNVAIYRYATAPNSIEIK